MKKKIIIGAIAAVLVVFFVVATVLGQSGGGPSFDVKVAKIVRSDISANVTASGTVEEVDKATVTFDTTLRVNKVLAQKNQKVKKGDPLLDLDLDSLESELKQLKINVEIQQLALDRAGNSDVVQSTTSAEASLEMAESALETAKRTLHDRTKDYQNSETLFQAGGVSSTEHEAAMKAKDDAQVALRNAELNVRTAQDALDKARTGNRNSSANKSIDVETQQKSLDLTKLKLAELEKRIARVKDNMVSPIDGTISECNVKDGEYTSAAQPAFVIIDPSQLQVTADIKEFNLGAVAEGQEVIITGDAIDKKDEVRGRITSISPVAKKSKTANSDETLVEVVIRIEKSVPVVKPGLSVTCDILTQTKKNALIATFQMIKEDKDSKILFVVDKNNIMHEKKVTIGITSDLSAEILDGVSEGDIVVLDPQPVYKEGVRAKIIEDKK